MTLRPAYVHFDTRGTPCSQYCRPPAHATLRGAEQLRLLLSLQMMLTKLINRLRMS